ncbi:MAG: PEP-CTERM sorting domain-containing protein [Phycisphaeraceae bacterium]
MNSFRISAAMMAAIVMVLTAAPAKAALDVSTTTGTSGTFAVSATDLIDQSQATFGSSSFTGTDSFGTGVAGLNDGIMYVVNDGDTTGSLTPTEGSVAIFNLDTSTNIAGYDITSIVTYTALSAGVRVGQSYDLEYSVVGSAAFLALTSVSVADGTGQEVRVTISDTLALPLATGVDALRFTFHDVAPFNEQVYREFDVVGSASVIPEPASLGLLAIGVGTMFLGRRRRA